MCCRSARVRGALRQAYVDGKLACQATLTCAVVPRVNEPILLWTRGRRSERSSKRHRRAGRRRSGILLDWSLLHHRPGGDAGENCKLISHVVLDGRTRIGARNVFHPFCSIGVAPQDLKYGGEPTETEIGDDNTIRESVTISRGTVKGGGVTRLGSNCLLMTCVHIGHDSHVGSHCILANAATLAGHVIIEDYVTLALSALCISSALWANMPSSAEARL